MEESISKGGSSIGKDPEVRDHKAGKRPENKSAKGAVRDETGKGN